MAKYWINDADETKLLSKYMVNDKHYGMWAIQIQDNKHEFHVVTAKGLVLGSKMCTRKGPAYSLFDGDNVELVYVAPTLFSMIFMILPAGMKRILRRLPGEVLNSKSFEFSCWNTGRTRGTFTVVVQKNPKHESGDKWSVFLWHFESE